MAFWTKEATCKNLVFREEHTGQGGGARGGMEEGRWSDVRLEEQPGLGSFRALRVPERILV